MSGSFENNSLGWQLHLLQQRLGEWLEGLFAPADRIRLPHWLLPEWLLRFLFWVIAGIVLGWLGWQIYQLARPYVRAITIANAGQSDHRSLTAAPSTIAAWLQRSRTFAQQGNYREACRALYIAALQRLNDAEPIPHEPSRTDGEYLQIVQTLPHTAPYQVLIHTHEHLCFDNADLSVNDFDRCQQAYRELEREGREF